MALSSQAENKLNFDGALTIIRGGGDLGTGVAWSLADAGFPVIVLEKPQPRMVRRRVCFSEAVYSGAHEVQGISAKLCSENDALGRALSECENSGNSYGFGYNHDNGDSHESGNSFGCGNSYDGGNNYSCAAWGSKVLDLGFVPVIVDPDGETIDICRPFCIVDARMLKKQLPSQMNDAPLTIGLGPGFIPGKNVNYAVETMRGPELGVCLADKEPLPDTGIPGVVAGESWRRVFKASVNGIFTSSHSIGDLVEAGEVIGYIGEIPVRTEISGVLRGLLRSGLEVVPGEKLGDTDPRGATVNVGAISDKAMKIGQSVLETVKGIYLSSKKSN